MKTYVLIFAASALTSLNSHALVHYKAEDVKTAELPEVVAVSPVQAKTAQQIVKKKYSPTLANEPNSPLGRSWSMIGEGQVAIVSQAAQDTCDDFKLGQIVSATIPMSVMAFAEGKAPVVADVYFESERAYRMLGEATVEKNSKRIAIEFKKLSNADGTKVFDIKAQALDKDGTYGLEGEIHTGEGKFFLAELLSAAAAGFADSTIKRPVNALGNQQEVQSFDTQGKKAVVSALNKSGEHFAEKLKQVTEYVTVDGPVQIRAIVIGKPSSK